MDLAQERMKQFHYRKFSHYIQALIEYDIRYAGKLSDFVHAPLPGAVAMLNEPSNSSPDPRVLASVRAEMHWLTKHIQ